MILTHFALAIYYLKHFIELENYYNINRNEADLNFALFLFILSIYLFTKKELYDAANVHREY